VVMMVGGPIFVSQPHWADEIGADATAPDARVAVDLALRLVLQTPNKKHQELN
jgi:methanogenic corrinoid protein MtbC1